MTAYDFGRVVFSKNRFSNGLIKKKAKIAMPNTTRITISREVIRKACVKKSISSPFKLHNSFKVSIVFYAGNMPYCGENKMSRYRLANHASCEVTSK